MKPFNSHDRHVIKPKEAILKSYNSDETGEQGTSFHNLNPDLGQEIGCFIQRMTPDFHSASHRHIGAEEFYVIEGDIRDHDGKLYKECDVVWLARGTVHNAYSETGCTVAMFSKSPEEQLDKI